MDKHYLGGARTMAVGFSIGDKGYIGHGVVPGPRTKFDFYEYDTTSNKWTKIEECGYAAGNSFTFSIENTGYVGTGFSDYGNQFWGYSPDASQVNSTELDELEIFPNPTSGLLTIIGSTTSIRSCKIIDGYGKVIKLSTIINNQLDISDLSCGLYFISVTGENEKPQIFRIVKL